MGTEQGANRPRRAFLLSSLALAPPALTANLLRAQISEPQDPEVRLPNGRKQSDMILKSDYDQNVKDARELTNLAKSIELDFEKNDQNVLPLNLLKKLDDVEKISKRIRARLRK
jgi:hypothetical protein